MSLAVSEYAPKCEFRQNGRVGQQVLFSSVLLQLK